MTEALNSHIKLMLHTSKLDMDVDVATENNKYNNIVRILLQK